MAVSVGRDEKVGQHKRERVGLNALVTSQQKFLCHFVRQGEGLIVWEVLLSFYLFLILEKE